MAIKILVISDYRETVTVRSEAEIFIALQKSGYEVSIMTYPESQYIQRFREAGIKVIEYHPTKKLSRKDVSIIKDEIVNGNYDILHLFNSPSMPNGIMAAYGTKVKVILYRGYTGNIHWYDPFMYIKYLSPRVDKIVCLVEAIRQLFLKNFVSERKLITINKGHDLAWYEGIEPDALAELHIPPDALKLVCAANMRPMKGVKYLLKATHYLPADANIHLLLLGRDMDAPEFKKLIDESPIKNNIHQLGYRKDVLNVVKACNVFVLASIKGEAITKAVIEAMSLGVAPLITDIPGNVDLVINEKCGLVVPSKNPEALAEAILKYDQQRQLVKIYGEAAKEHIKNSLNIKDTIAQFQQMYDELLNA